MFGLLGVEPNIFVLTETWLKDCNTDLCNVDCYQPFNTCCPDRRSGGVSVICKKSVKDDVFSDLPYCSRDIETCVVSCKFELDYVVVSAN